MAKRNHTVGLDIGTSKVTCVVGEPGEAGTADQDVAVALERGPRGPALGGPDRHPC